MRLPLVFLKFVTMRGFSFIFLAAGSCSLLQAQNLSARVSYDVFQDDQHGTVFEHRLWISGNALQYKKEQDGMYRGRAELTLALSQQGKIVAFDKVELFSAPLKDTVGDKPDLFDVRRLPTPPGACALDVMVRDLAARQNKGIHHIDSVHISPITKEVTVGPVVLFDENAPGEANPMPHRASLMYTADAKRIRFSTPIYHAVSWIGPQGKMAVRYTIRNADTQVSLDQFTIIQRKKATHPMVLSGDLPIETLPTGQYFLSVEILDSTGKFVTSNRVFFARENADQMLSEEELFALAVEGTFMEPIQSRDTLVEMIQCLAPVSSNQELVFAQNVLKEKEIKKMKQFILSFWQRRYGENAASGWQNYAKGVNAVNKEFSTPNTPGYRTDRGRIYLQYGPPNVINKRYDEPSAYPYEIWQYYQLKSQTNIRFVFYNNSGMDNTFVLLHSDLRGEINNRQWEMFVHNRNNSFNVDQNNVIRHYGNWSNDIFRQPR